MSGESIVVPAQHAKPKLSIPEQINYMRDERGIKFNIVDEETAAEILSTRNYYFKLKAFAKNYSVYNSGPEKGKYCDLEFAYLYELSSLDMHLRETVLTLALDVEHYLKVRLLADISKDNSEDGYAVVKQFLKNHPDVEDKIAAKAVNSYCEQLVKKYSGDYPVWAFVEVLSMGDLISFCDDYYFAHPGLEKGMIGNLRIVKFLRNAAAHNNLLINNLANNASREFKQSRIANSFVGTIKGISAKTQDKKMGNRTMHDFVVLLLTFDKLASDSSKERQYKKLKSLLEGRFLKHKEYFSENGLLVSNYDFLKKVVDKIIEGYI